MYHTPRGLAVSVTTFGPNESHNRSTSPASTRGSINIDTIRELLRSHEQDIVNPVVHQLNSQISTQHPATYRTWQALPPSHSGTQPPLFCPTQPRMAELENQLAQLRAHQGLKQTLVELNVLGMLNPARPLMWNIGEIASGIIDSVETIFPGVERGTVIQIIENRFKSINIYLYWLARRNQPKHREYQHRWC